MADPRTWIKVKNPDSPAAARIEEGIRCRRFGERGAEFSDAVFCSTAAKDAIRRCATRSSPIRSSSRRQNVFAPVRCQPVERGADADARPAARLAWRLVIGLHMDPDVPHRLG